jgi:methyl-accepting chemotaxis protein
MKKLFSTVRLKSMKYRFIIFGGGLIFLFAAILSIYASVTRYNMIVEAAKENAMVLADAQAANIKTQMETAMNASRTVSEMLKATKNTEYPALIDRLTFTNMMRQILEENPQFSRVFTVWEPNAYDNNDANFVNRKGHDDSGRFVTSWIRDGNGNIKLSPMENYNQEEAGKYYLLPKRTKQETIIDPYFSKSSGSSQLMTSLITPIIVNNNFQGITGVDISIAFLQQFADQLKESKSDAKMTIISNNGILAGVTGKPELAGKHGKDILVDWDNKYIEMQAGREYFTENKNGSLDILIPFWIGNSPDPWAVNIEIPMDTMIKEGYKSLFTTILISLILTAIVIVAFWFIINSIINPMKIIIKSVNSLAAGDTKMTGVEHKAFNNINHRHDELGEIGRAFTELTSYMNEISNNAQLIADGDLSNNFQPKSEDDELGISFSQMILKLRDMIGLLKLSANRLTSASEQLAQASSHAGQATSQITSTIQQIARGASQQTESVTKTASSIEQMSQVIDGVAHGAQEQASAINKASTATTQLSFAIQHVSEIVKEVSGESATASESATSGVQTVQATIHGIQTIKETVDLSAQKVQEMGSRSNQIGAIVDTIDDIASQTNMLALNAAIEAARAGEYGQGFAVVADEVRRLAERSSSATKEINELIKGIQNSITEAISAMNKGTEEVDMGVSRTNTAEEALNIILHAVEKVSQQANLATAAVSKMNTSAAELVSSVDSVSAIVEENTAATEEMSASSHEVTQSIENIASISEENSAAVEEVSASAEDMNTQIDQITNAAQELSDMARALNMVANRFKIE